jgi:hypothetical protein
MPDPDDVVGIFKSMLEEVSGVINRHADMLGRAGVDVRAIASASTATADGKDKKAKKVVDPNKPK